jgi:hypothetical protein
VKNGRKNQIPKPKVAGSMPVARFNTSDNKIEIYKNDAPILKSAFSFLGDSLASRARHWRGFAARARGP